MLSLVTPFYGKVICSGKGRVYFCLSEVYLVSGSPVVEPMVNDRFGRAQVLFSLLKHLGFALHNLYQDTLITLCQVSNGPILSGKRDLVSRSY